MKANELMVGDWVYDPEPDADGYIYKFIIEPEDFTNKTFLDSISPIPITLEILKKNGFEEIYYDGYHYGLFSYKNNEEKCDIELDPENGCFECYFDDDINSLNIKIKYVHELQHILRMCGIDKEIVL